MSTRIPFHPLALAVVAIASLGAAGSAYALDDFDSMPWANYVDVVIKGKEAYVEKRYDEALPLLKQAACAGDKESQWSLGNMYLQGLGTQRDDVTGYSWLSAAAEMQPSPYSTAFAKIDASIDPGQRTALKSKADTFVTNYGTRATRMSCRQTASRGGHVLDRISCEPTPGSRCPDPSLPRRRGAHRGHLGESRALTHLE